MEDKAWGDMNKKERANLVRFYLIDLRWTYGKLASYLNVTRNVIAGVCNRHGIKIPKHTIKIQPSTLEAEHNVIPFPVAKRPEEGLADMAKKLKAKRKNSAQSAAIERMAGRELDMNSLFLRDPRPLREEFWKPLPSSQPVSLEDANHRHCRWPVSEDNHTCCGAPAKEGKPYCVTHCEIAYRPAPPIAFRKKKNKAA